MDEDKIFRILDSSSEVWPKIIHADDKIFIISHYIKKYGKSGVKIAKKANFYSVVIDDFLNRNTQYLRLPLDQVLKIVSVMEYDFDDGDDKDNLAFTVLGQKGYVANKKRLGIK